MDRQIYLKSHKKSLFSFSKKKLGTERGVCRVVGRAGLGPVREEAAAAVPPTAAAFPALLPLPDTSTSGEPNFNLVGT